MTAMPIGKRKVSEKIRKGKSMITATMLVIIRFNMIILPPENLLHRRSDVFC